MTEATVLIVDDHRVVREGLRSLLEQEPGLRVVAEAVSADQALGLARDHRPDVIVLDNHMPGGDGLDLIPTLRNELPRMRIVMFSLDPGLEEQAKAAGADAFVAKDASTREIIDALRAPVAGTPHVELRGPALPGFPTTRDMRHAALVLAGVLVVYLVLFLAIEPVIGASAGVFSTLAVFVAGLLLGPEMGVAAALLAMSMTLALWSATGHRPGEAILQVGTPGAGFVLLLVLGAAAGALRTLGLRFDRRARRVEAIAEAVRSLSGLEPAQLVDVFLQALLRTVPGELALLVESGRADARVLASSTPLATADVAAVVRLALASGGHAAVIDTLREELRPLPQLRSAVIVPAAHGGAPAPALIVVFDTRTERYTLEDVERIRVFAEYLWLLMTQGAGAATPGDAPASSPRVAH